MVNSHQDFINRLKLLVGKQPLLLTTTLSNIFTMRLIGNKTHGDLAEIAILSKEHENIINKDKIKKILNDEAFSVFQNINVLPLIYDESKEQCNILVFDYLKAKNETTKILKISEGKGRKHPIFRFFNSKDEYICEVRYGGTDANALQRGLWTNTKNGIKYFDSITNGWIKYSHNKVLVKLFSCALVSSDIGHKSALEEIKNDIIRLKKQLGKSV